MCGITGSIIFNPSVNIHIEKYTDEIQHRGPDNKGYYTDANVSLGHQRLSIVDLSENGAQPMFSSDERYVLVFNGEIYNHLALREKISFNRFQSRSDTETLLYGLIEFGQEFLNDLNGIFAFAFYDKVSKDILIARDHFGVKPLYYYKDEDVILFSSELKSFSNYKGLNKDIDQEAILNYVHLLWSPFGKTPLKYVKKLEGGHLISLNALQVHDTWNIQKYYELPFNGNYIEADEDELVRLLEEQLLKAVKRQLMSDVPVGYFLSGGVDSSLIVAMAKQLMPNGKLICFTIDTGEEKDNDGLVNDIDYARKVAKIFDCELHEVAGDINIMNEFDYMVYHLDEPQGDIAPLSVGNICRLAKEKGIKVLIGGVAGDDLFSGYRRHQAIHYQKYLKHIPRGLVQLLKTLTQFLPISNPFFRRLNKLLAGLSLRDVERNFEYFRWLPYQKVKSLFKDKSITYDPRAEFEELLKSIPEEKSQLNRMLFWEIKTFLTDHNLNYTDKMSMAHGVEVRVPFLDKELVEFSCKIPPSLKLKGLDTKYLLKKILLKYLPKEVIYRTKSGFGGPLRKWIQNDLHEKIEDYLSESSIRKRNIFDANELRSLIEDNKKGKIDASYSILSLLAIESWMRQFVDEK